MIAFTPMENDAHNLMRNILAKKLSAFFTVFKMTRS